MAKANFNADIKDTLDSMLLDMPQVKPGKMFGYPAYYVNGKMFACVYEDGVGLKVPESMVHDLVGEKGITYFQPLGRKQMKEWIQITREDPAEYLRDLEIFEISAGYVSLHGKE